MLICYGFLISLLKILNLVKCNLISTFCQNQVNLKSFYAFKPSKAIQSLFSFKTGSDIIIMALPHYNFSPSKVQINDHNLIRDWFEFQ